MALGWVVFLLLLGGSEALESSQVFNVSQRCMNDTNTFLWEINQDEPKEYAVLSKCCCLLQNFFLKIALWGDSFVRFQLQGPDSDGSELRANFSSKWLQNDHV